MGVLNLIVGLMDLFIGNLFIVLSIPLLRGRVPMNKAYGVRIGKAFSSEENWRRMNEYGAKRLIFWSVPILLAGLLSLVAPPDSAFVLIMAFAPLLVLVAVVEILRYSKTLK